MAFTAAFFYKGFFVKDPELKYIGGEVRPYKADSDKWSFFEIVGIIRDFDKDAGTIRIWWKQVETPLETGLFKIANDEDALIVSNYAIGQDAEVHIYVEYVTDATSNVAYPVCVDEVNGVRTGVRSNDKGENPINYVHRYYSKMCYKDCYDQIISPINGENKWPITEFPHILPPQFKRGPGRPKILRRRDPDEAKRENGNWSRSNTTNNCTRCTQPGHNKRSCKNPAVNVAGPSTQPRQTVAEVPMPTQASQTIVTEVPMPKKMGRPRKAQTETSKPKKSKNADNTPATVNEPMIASQEVDDVIAKLKKPADFATSKHNVSQTSMSEPIMKVKNSATIEAKNILEGLKTVPPNELDETTKKLISGLVKWNEEYIGKGKEHVGKGKDSDT